MRLPLSGHVIENIRKDLVVRERLKLRLHHGRNRF